MAVASEELQPTSGRAKPGSYELCCRATDAAATRSPSRGPGTFGGPDQVGHCVVQFAGSQPDARAVATRPSKYFPWASCPSNGPDRAARRWKRGQRVLEISATASDAITREQQARALPVTGGVRIYRRPTPDDLTPGSLAVAFVAEPRQGDAIFRRGSAVVFVDREIGDFVESRVLDVDGAAVSPPKLVLRRQHRAQ
jgi:hypothetical protein